MKLKEDNVLVLKNAKRHNDITLLLKKNGYIFCELKEANHIKKSECITIERLEEDVYIILPAVCLVALTKGGYASKDQDIYESSLFDLWTHIYYQGWFFWIHR